MKTQAPRATIAIAVVTAAAFVLLPRGFDATLLGGFIPARALGLAVPGALPVWLTPISAALLHGSIFHLGLNLLMLFFCGKQDEVALGWVGVAVLYLAGAYAAAALQFLIFQHSSMPMIGASGAISALVGAYALLYGQRRPSSLHPELARWLHIAWLAAAWVGVQLLIGLGSAASGVMVATAAHIGGFLAGLLLARPLLRWRYRRA